MKPQLLKEIIEKIRNVKIAIVGDFCLDAYWFVDESKSEISIETGEATRPVRQQKYSLGGAGNVANNLAAMKVRDIRAFGVIGNDPFGAEMVSIMKSTGIDTRNLLIQNENWATHVYIKPYVEGAEQGRIDFGNFNGLLNETAGSVDPKAQGRDHRCGSDNYQSTGFIRNSYRIFQAKACGAYQ